MARVIRNTEPGDIPRLMEIFADARQTMRSDGNLEQWSGTYPDPEAIMRDISRGVSHVIEDDGRICGTFAFVPGIEPAYNKIYGGQWLDDDLPYATVHRIAGGHGSHGVFDSCLDWCQERISSIRIDTHRDNRIMQKLISRSGFSYCGIILLADGAERLAYQRIAGTGQ